MSFGLSAGADSLSQLAENEQIAYLKILVYLAKVDGNFEDSEKRFIRDMALLYGVSDDKLAEITEDVDMKTILKSADLIKDRRVALELVKDLCVLAHADEELLDEEVEFIGDVGQKMGVSLDKIEQISRWVIDRIIWLEESKIIFEEI